MIYVYRYQMAVGWPALGASGELSLAKLFSDGTFIGHWFIYSLPQLLAEQWASHSMRRPGAVPRPRFVP